MGRTGSIYDSKTTTLPIVREIVLTYVLSVQKFPWFIDFLNINLTTTDLEEAVRRIGFYRDRFVEEGVRVTENLDFLG